MRKRSIPLRAVAIDEAKHHQNGRVLFLQAELQGSLPSLTRKHTSGQHTTLQQRTGHMTASNLELQGEIDTYIRAAEQFRMSSSQLDAAKAYEKAAFLSSEKLKKPDKAALLYTEAALCLEKLDSSLAVAPLSRSVSQYCNSSAYDKAALTEKRLGSMHEMNSEWESSIEHYRRAAKLSLRDNFSDAMYEKAAFLLEKNEEYLEASLLYRDLAFSCASRELNRFEVPSYVLRSGILLLAQGGDTSHVQELSKEACAFDCRVGSSGELRFLNDLCNVLTRKDIDAFADSLYSYNGMHELGSETLTALGKIRDLVCGNEC